MNHQNVVKNFAKGKNYKGHNVFAEGNVLYSYGRHFPLAVRRGNKTKEWYLLNGDKYSSSTAKHQSMTYQTFSNHPRVSFSALSAAGINFQTCNLIDFTRDQHQCVETKDAGFDNFRQSVPSGAEYHETKDQDGNITNKSFHRVGTAILEQNKKYYLCSMDEQSYFISLLPKKVKTVEKGFQSLKPSLILIAEKNEIEWKRQGEWFFIPSELKFKDGDFQKAASLPSADSSSNLHICTRLLQKKNNFYVKGCIRHQNRQGRRGDHKMVKLGDGIFQAVCNTAKGNWSSGGRVD